MAAALAQALLQWTQSQTASLNQSLTSSSNQSVTV
jgi:hypothetical protein